MANRIMAMVIGILGTTVTVLISIIIIRQFKVTRSLAGVSKPEKSLVDQFRGAA